MPGQRVLRSPDPLQGLPQPLHPRARDIVPGPFAGPLRPRTPHQGHCPWTQYAKVVEFVKDGFSAYCLRKRKDCFHGHHKTKTAAGNRASTFRQQPFVFPSASHPDGGINAALPVGVDPVCVMEETLGLASFHIIYFATHENASLVQRARCVTFLAKAWSRLCLRGA